MLSEIWILTIDILTTKFKYILWECEASGLEIKSGERNSVVENCIIDRQQSANFKFVRIKICIVVSIVGFFRDSREFIKRSSSFFFFCNSITYSSNHTLLFQNSWIVKMLLHPPVNKIELPICLINLDGVAVTVIWWYGIESHVSSLSLSAGEIIWATVACLYSGLVGKSMSFWSLCGINLPSQQGPGDMAWEHVDIPLCLKLALVSLHAWFLFELDTGWCVFLNVFEVRNINRSTDQPSLMVVWRETEPLIQENVLLRGLSTGFINQTSIIWHARN